MTIYSSYTSRCASFHLRKCHNSLNYIYHVYTPPFSHRCIWDVLVGSFSLVMGVLIKTVKTGRVGFGIFIVNYIGC